MAKAELKTVATPGSVADFLAAVPDPRRRDDAALVDALHRRVTGCDPVMWGPSIVGYGSYDYRYDSGRTGTMCRGGFSPRKAAMTIYLTGPYGDRQAEADALFVRLGKHSTGKACLYIKRLSHVDLDVLEKLVALSWAAMNATYPA
ncbi:MAG: DUF1801 domain-containing protein [Novosphingobium sp.]|uniref:DUF1801 domain-containing protein n=1 Tax=Novosphingobium sp. TaxID=1874826 RepID=UPI0032B7091F